MKNKLTKDMVLDGILEILNPEKAKIKENGIAQTSALQSVIARARAANNQNLNKQVERTRNR